MLRKASTPFWKAKAQSVKSLPESNFGGKFCVTKAATFNSCLRWSSRQHLLAVELQVGDAEG